MAFVAITAASLTFKGRSGTYYNVPWTKATAVGYATFTQNGDTNITFPEDVMMVDAYVGDAVNAADYADFYIDGVVKPQMRLLVNAINDATTIPRTAPGPWIRAKSTVRLYYYSA